MIRTLDIILALSALIVISPVFLTLIVILRFTGEGEIFYRQMRIGRQQKVFYVLKFATMLKNSPSMGLGTITVQNDSRILPLGHFLRKTKINELPQLLNVILGDMSLIGPRPLTKENFCYYSQDVQKSISNVRPGLSGIGSIFFRGEENLLANASDKKIFYSNIIAPYKGDLEMWFVKNNSTMVYFKIILVTIVVILNPKSKLVAYFFRDLPVPPKKLQDIMEA